MYPRAGETQPSTDRTDPHAHLVLAAPSGGSSTKAAAAPMEQRNGTIGSDREAADEPPRWPTLHRWSLELGSLTAVTPVPFPLSHTHTLRCLPTFSLPLRPLLGNIAPFSAPCASSGAPPSALLPPLRGTVPHSKAMLSCCSSFPYLGHIRWHGCPRHHAVRPCHRSCAATATTERKPKPLA